MRAIFLLVLPSLLLACASAEPAQRDDAATATAAEPTATADPGSASPCELAMVTARSAWRKQFDRVPDLAPSDRAAMADEHSKSSDSELGELEATAREAGDDTMLEAIEATRRAREICAE